MAGSAAAARSLTYCFSWTNDKGNHTLENRAISITQEGNRRRKRRKARKEGKWSGQFRVPIMSWTRDPTPLMDSKMGPSAIFRPFARSFVAYNQS